MLEEGKDSGNSNLDIARGATCTSRLAKYVGRLIDSAGVGGALLECPPRFAICLDFEHFDPVPHVNAVFELKDDVCGGERSHGLVVVQLCDLEDGLESARPVSRECLAAKGRTEVLDDLEECGPDLLGRLSCLIIAGARSALYSMRFPRHAREEINV